LRAFWIGRAGTYVEIDGQRLLPDPVFSEHASAFSIGPRRFHPPPITLAGLPPIDAVLISHDHYDHLNTETVRHLAARGSRFFVPLGIGAHLERWGVPAAQVEELEWWQERTPGCPLSSPCRWCATCAPGACFRSTGRRSTSRTTTGTSRSAAPWPRPARRASTWRRHASANGSMRTSHSSPRPGGKRCAEAGSPGA